ncbi:hypothetical protein BC940DRAFT_241627 [Gongronella butleri]|nr:hypothetical protein BC940DRAFT_241627 [Gongronella butleri]
MRVLLLATVAVSAIQAFTFKEVYPDPGSSPQPKPEWLELIKGANITKAPVYKVAAGQSPKPQGSGDPYCDWTFTGCFGKEDLYQCPKGQWSVTYDDGPSEDSARLYDELDKTNTKVTFFMVGGQVVKYPDLTLRAFKAGHELAMHTWSHSYMTTLTNEQIVAELKWNEQAIKEVTGFSPRLFRPPYGDIDNRVRDVAKALGFTPVIWTHDTQDWHVSRVDKTFKPEWVDNNVTQWAKEAPTMSNGGMSLEHDLYNVTVDAAIRVLPTFLKTWKVTTVGTCNAVASYKEGVNPNVNNATQPSASGNATGNATKPSGSASANQQIQSNKTSGASALTTSVFGLGFAAVVAAVLAA